MTDNRRSDLRKILNSLAIVIGALLIAGAVGIVIVQADFSVKQTASEVVADLDELIPSRKRAFPESHYGNNMPNAEIKGEDFVGLLEIPAFSVRLPVASDWQYADKDRFPALYSGSVYDGDVIIGGNNSNDQFFFVDEIEIGSEVVFVDLFGREFHYEVSMVNHADALESIESGEESLTLFAPSSMTSKYVIIRCKLMGM